MPNLSNTVLQQLPVRLPPFPEQQKIAGVLGLVLRAMEQLAGVAPVLGEVGSQPWASITFSGVRHRIAVTLDGDAAVVDRLMRALPEAEIPLVGEMVADLTVEIEALGERAGRAFAELVVMVLTVRH